MTETYRCEDYGEIYMVHRKPNFCPYCGSELEYDSCSVTVPGSYKTMNHKTRLDDKFGPSEHETEWNFYEDLDVIESGIDSGTEITLEREFEAKCPTDGHTDEYLLAVEYQPSSGRVLEIESFSDWLDAFSETEAPQEAWCDFILHSLWLFLDPDELDVYIRGRHYGVETTVEKGRSDE